MSFDQLPTLKAQQNDAETKQHEKHNNNKLQSQLMSKCGRYLIVEGDDDETLLELS